jgi:hypothetical protein
MARKNTRILLTALILMLVSQPFSTQAGFSTPWFSYRYGASYGYPEGMKAPSDPRVVGFWVMAEPVDALEYFEGHSNQSHFPFVKRDSVFLQHRLILRDNGLGNHKVFKNVVGFKEAYCEIDNGIGYTTDMGRLSMVFETDSGTNSFFCPIFGVEDCKECQQYGGHQYTVTDTSLSLEYESVDGKQKTFVLTRWIPEANALSVSEAMRAFEIISVNSLAPPEDVSQSMNNDLIDMSIQPGETYAFHQTEGGGYITWKGTWGTGSYVLHDINGNISESGHRFDGFFGEKWISQGMTMVLTVHQETQTPVELSYKEGNFRVERQEQPAFLEWSIQPGETYRFTNHYHMPVHLKLLNIDTITFINYFWEDGTVKIEDVQQEIATLYFSDLRLKENSSLLVQVNPEASEPFMLAGESIYFSGELSEQPLQNLLRILGTGEEAVYENTGLIAQPLSLCLDGGLVDYSYIDVQNNHIIHLFNVSAGNLPETHMIMPGEWLRLRVHLSAYESNELCIFGDLSALSPAGNMAEAAVRSIMQNGVNSDVYGLFGSYNYSLKYLDELSIGEIFLFGVKYWKDTVKAFLLSPEYDHDVAEAFMRDAGRARRLLKTILDRMTGSSAHGDSSQLRNNLNKAKGVDELIALLSEKGLADSLLDIIDKALKAEERFSHFVNDYTSHITLLQKLSEVLPQGDNHLRHTIDKLINHYLSNFISDAMVEDFRDWGLKSLDAVTGLKFKAADTIIKGFFAHDKSLEGLEAVIGLAPIKADLIEAFKASARRIQDGDRSPETISNYILLFDMCREAIILEYEAMLTKYQDDVWSVEAGYLERQLSILNDMTFYQYQYAGGL